MLEAAENGLLCAGQRREGGGSRGSPHRPPARGIWGETKASRGTGSSDMSWAVGRAHESVSVSKGLPAGLQGHLGTRGQPHGVGQPGYSPARMAAQILSSWKDGNKKCKRGLSLQDLDLQE